MDRENLIGEKFVSHIWDNGHFTKDRLRAKDGRRIEVLFRGQWNDGSGADFRDAQIKVDGQIYNGDVEVHLRSSDWRVHHHDADPRYNKTIIHVALWDSGITLLTKKQNGERIPTLILSDYLDDSIGKLLGKVESEKRSRKCRAGSETIASETLCITLDRAGADRFLNKAEIYAKRLENSGEDELLYEGIMESLGYSENSKQFINLSRIAPLKVLLGQNPEVIQAILFGVSGLIPARKKKFDADAREYLNRIEVLWEPFLTQFQDKLMHKEQWEFSRTRPENFPTRRIAGMSYILSRVNGSLFSAFKSAFIETDKASMKLQDILMPYTSGYWTTHYTFGGKKHKENPFLIGKNKSADIVINVILPVIFAYAQQSGNQELQQSVMKVYSGHRRLQENKITRYLADNLFPERQKYFSVVNSAMRQQGLIGLYKSFCAVRNCQNCPFVEGKL